MSVKLLALVVPSDSSVTLARPVILGGVAEGRVSRASAGTTRRGGGQYVLEDADKQLA